MATTSKKMTYSVAISAAIEALTDSSIENAAEAIERLTALSETLAKRNATKSGKPTKKQVENQKLAGDILAAIEVGKTYAAAELAKVVPALEGMTPQKIAPLCKSLVEAGSLVLVEGKKGQKLYALAEVEEVEG